MPPSIEAGPSDAQPGAPTSESPGSWGKKGCPPGPRNEACLIVFARKALAFGLGNAYNSIGFAPAWGKVKGQVHKGLCDDGGISTLAFGLVTGKKDLLIDLDYKK